MGVIRGGLLAIVSVLLFVSLFASLLFFTMSWSLNYDNVRVELKEVVNNTLKDELGVDRIVDDNLEEMRNYCTQYSDYVIEIYDRKITVPCSYANDSLDVIIDRSTDNFIERIYFAQYDCDFWSCFKSETIPFFLVSAKAQAYWYSKFNFMLLIIGGLSILGFLLAQKKSNFFLLVSVLLVVASFPFMKMEWIISLTGTTASGLLTVFFSKAYNVFIYGVMIGVALFALGLILKLFRVGLKIQTIFEKKEEEKVDKEEVKEAVKEEVSKVKKEKPAAKPAKKEAKPVKKISKKVIKKTKKKKSK